jgi:acid phosphatase family membrane protein YuiD
MHDIVEIFAVFKNRIFWISMLAWLIAQILKVTIDLLVKKKVDFRRLVSAGGMPSSHSAFVVALSTAVGLVHGFDSALFAVSAAFAGIIMYDAAGVRRAVGIQAGILNEMMDDLNKHRPVGEQKLRELIGHTPIEVFAGAVLGFLVSWFLI